MSETYKLYDSNTKVAIKSTGEKGEAFESFLNTISVFIDGENKCRYFNIEDVEFANEISKEEKLKELRKILKLNKSGFAGVLSNGNIVDRRKFPEAIPIQENKMFGVVKPKKLKLDKK